jgi:dynein heavy chain
MFTKEELEEIENDLRPIAAQNKIYDNMYGYFVQRVRENLHVVLCMSPVGDLLRVRMRMFPSLVNCCTINWVDPWPGDALLSVSKNKLKDLPLEDLSRDEGARVKDAIAALCVEIHISVQDTAFNFQQALNRKVYITPKSYLDMIGLYFKLLEEKTNELGKNKSKYKRGVETIEKTNIEVNKMQEDLTKLKPILEQKKIEADELSKVVEADTIEANKVKEEAESEEKVVSEQAAEVMKVQQDAQADLDEALPILESALKALDQINPRDIAEIRTFAAPAVLIKYTLEAVSILLQEKTDWDSIKKTLQSGIIERLRTYPKDSIPKPVLIKLRKKIAENPDFTPEKVGAVSVASKSLCLWVHAMDKYSKVSEEVQPKRDRLEQMNKILADAMGKLKLTQARLKKEMDKVAALEEKRQKVLDERDRLTNEARTTGIRLERAAVLTESLKAEHVRWQENVVKLTTQMRNVVGDTFLSSACISYYGPFTGVYRNQLVQNWMVKASELKIPVSDNFDLQEVMGDPMTIRDWNIKGLPADTVSVNNGILVTRCERWPLMIDPQEQANKWIKKLEEKAGIKVNKQTDRDFTRSVENSIRNGNSLLIEDVGEVLDPTLEPILQKNLIEQGAGRYALRVGDQDVDYDMNFRLFLTTKLPNPHYLPEISIKTTLINFTVTTQGLEEQLLGDVVKKEQPKIEKKKTELMIAMVKDQKSLKQAEDTILSSLSDTKGNILDNPEIIETLKSSKKLSNEISDRMLRAEEIKKEVEEAFQQYLNVAVRGSILYFVVADLALIDPMYQYSLAYFARLFNSVIDNSQKSNDVQERINILINSITEFVFMNICRGLFNVHKLIFSFLITSQILRREGMIADVEWSLLLKGVSLVPSTFIKTINPDSGKITEKTWDLINYLQNITPVFNKPLLGPEIAKNLPEWLTWATCPEPESTPLPAPYTDISQFHQLLLVKAFREEKVIYKIIKFVEASMGRKFIEVPPIVMEEVYVDTNCKSPIIFILSQGADPMSMIVRLSESMGFTEKLEILSLGKGQGERAKKLIEACCKTGKWVVLQNCHLAKSWMPDLESLVENFEDPRTNIHEDFRLMLTSMPCDYFPVPVLQNGTKVTNEPPKGIRANLLRSLNAISDEEFETCEKVVEWKKLLVATCFFHAIIQERRKFGPLGWNIRYEFNESDLETSILMLKNFLNTTDEAIPWDAMRFMTGQINYGGRVTDDWDRRCLMSVLNYYLIPQVIKDDYKLSQSGRYFVPPVGPLSSFKSYVESLPLTDDPEIFGMHENANITFQMQESQSILSTSLSIQPRDTGKSGSGKGPDEIVDELAAAIYDQLPAPMLKTEAAAGTFARDKNGLMDSLATFLGQEIVRFNKLLQVMKRTLEGLRKAIKGVVVMSNELDKMYTSMLNNQVPENWGKVAYPSLRPLGSWVNDMKERVAFIRKWLSVGKPDAYWLSAFFFPQGFLTAVLQSFSRKYQIAIDILNFSFDFQPFNTIDQIQEVSEDGCYIYGLYMEGCRWDLESLQLEESFPAEMYAIAPIIFFTPAENYVADAEDYTMPVYKTSVRAGTLSTTGHSTNFIIGIECPTNKKPSHWVLKGSAFLCQLND